MKTPLLIVLLLSFFGCSDINDMEVENDIAVTASFSIGSVNGQEVSIAGSLDYCQDGITRQISNGGSGENGSYNRLGNRIIDLEGSNSAIVATVSIGTSEELLGVANLGWISAAERFTQGSSTDDFHLQLEFLYNGIVYSTFLLNQLNPPESVKDSNSEMSLNMALDDNVYCNPNGQIITCEWNYSGYAYGRSDRLDSIYIEDVVVWTQNGY